MPALHALIFAEVFLKFVQEQCLVVVFKAFDEFLVGIFGGFGDGDALAHFVELPLTHTGGAGDEAYCLHHNVGNNGRKLFFEVCKRKGGYFVGDCLNCFLSIVGEGVGNDVVHYRHDGLRHRF